jgi:hypothetical protein
MFFALAVLSGIIPGEAGKTVSMFLLPLAAAILTGILAGSIHGLLMGALSALVIFLIRRDTDFLRDTLPVLLTWGTSGFFAGFVYGRTGTAIGAAVSGVLAGRITLSISKILILYFLGEPYTVFAYLEEAVTGVWPGLIICLAGIPVIIFMLRKIGVMAILREERNN